MAAETELTGTIKLTADTTEAEKKVESLDEGTSEKAAESAKKALESVSGTLRNIFRDIGNLTGGVFQSLASSLDNVFGRVQKGVSGISHATQSAGNATRSVSSALASAPAAGGAAGGGGNNLLSGIMAMFGKVPTGAGGAGGGTVTAAGAAAGGAAGGGGGAAGVAAGGAGGAAGITASFGPIGVAVAAIAASAAVAIGLAAALKDVTERVMDFGRSLASASPSMAQLFAVFDVQIMLMKRQIGEALAPAFAELLPQITELARQAMPLLVGAMQLVIGALTELFQDINQAMAALKLTTGVQNGVMEAAIGDPVGGIKEIAASIKEWFSWQKEQALKKDAPMPAIMQNYMDMLSKEGSAQRNYQKSLPLQQRQSDAGFGTRLPEMGK